MFYFGAHIPREKGPLVKTLKRLCDAGGNTLQIFVGNPYGGRVNRKDWEEQAPQIRAFLKEHNARIFIHSAYTLNFAKSKEDEQPYWIDVLWDELQVAETIGAEGCVLHMGKAVKRSVDEAEDNMVSNLKEVIGRMAAVVPKIFIETSAGQGSELFATRSNSLDPLQRLWQRFTSDEQRHVAFCVDTCHIFAAGYDISHRTQVAAFFDEWDTKLGLKALGVIHLNNSTKELGCSVDRHACLAYGKIPFEALAAFATHGYLKKIPVILETPAPLEEVAYLVQLAEKMATQTFTLPKSASEPVLIVDCGYLMFYRYHATKRSLSFKLKREPTHDEILEAYPKHMEEQIKKTIKKTKANSLVIFCKDNTRASLWRTKLWPEYKATRAETSTEMHACFQEMEGVIQRYGHVLQLPHLEADDLAALAFKTIEQTRPDQKIVFLTNDRDYLQLLRSAHVRILDAGLKEITGSGQGNNVDVMTKVLMGDKSDNIPPVCKNCGPKTAHALAQDPARLEAFLKEKNCHEAFDRNEQLIRLDNIPHVLAESFAQAYSFQMNA
jgi:deoxyribonuclease IV